MASSTSAKIKARITARKNTLATWQTFIEWSLTKQAPRWVFRGQTQHWPLRPSVGRSPDYKPELEIMALNEFKRHSVSLFDTAALNDGWNWLALAQHHGLPTRLLDWSFNPLVAAFFASQPSPRQKRNGIIYAIETRMYGFQDEKFPELDPFEVDEDVFLRTPTHIPRLRMQKGLFSVHPEPNKPFASGTATRFEIPAEDKVGFQRLIYNLGIDASFLMADLDGLSATIKWRQSQGFLG